jgi:hypothetical protein
MQNPTCEDLYDRRSEEYELVLRETDASWRHGSYVSAVYKRVGDETYWMAQYRLSTDGETNELREGSADIYQVEPFEKVTIDYRPVTK